MSNLVLIGIIVASVIAVVMITAITVTKLYKRTKKGFAFVKTGFGGEKVVIDGGAIILPILHEVVWVSMKTRRITVSRTNTSALITKDKFRVDVDADFYLRVKQNSTSVAIAAQSLGEGAMQDEQLKRLMESKFVDALRAVASSMTMNDLHEKRSEFVQSVQNGVQDELEKNGIELESVSLTSLDQTNIDNLDPNNAFDAEGMTQLTQIIEDRKKTRNDIEQNNKIQIQQKNLEAEKRTLEIEEEEELVKAEQERNIKVAQVEREREAKEAEILAQQKVQQANISKDKTVQEAEIDRVKTIDIANQQKNIEINIKSQEESASQAEANVAKAKAVAADEKISTAKDTEIAERQKSIALINAQREAQEKAVSIKVAAEADKEAAQNKAEAVLVEAKAGADAVKLKASAHEAELLAEANGQREINLAQNQLSSEIVKMNVTIETIKQAPLIMKEMMKPVEKIDGIKMINVGGLGGMTGGNGGDGTVVGGGNGGNGGGMMNDLFSGLMGYQTAMPVIKDILADAGLDTSSPQNLLESVEEVTAPEKAKARTAKRVGKSPSNTLVDQANQHLSE